MAANETNIRGKLLDALETDTTRKPFERESCIRWSAAADRVRVDTAERSLMRRFLSHPEFELDNFAARYGERGEKAYGPDAEGWEGEDVLSIRGTLPIGCVVVKAESRADSGHSKVVSRTVLDGEPGGDA